MSTEGSSQRGMAGSAGDGATMGSWRLLPPDIREDGPLLDRLTMSARRVPVVRRLMGWIARTIARRTFLACCGLFALGLALLVVISTLNHRASLTSMEATSLAELTRALAALAAAPVGSGDQGATQALVDALVQGPGSRLAALEIHDTAGTLLAAHNSGDLDAGFIGARTLPGQPVLDDGHVVRTDQSVSILKPIRSPATEEMAGWLKVRWSLGAANGWPLSWILSQIGAALGLLLILSAALAAVWRKLLSKPMRRLNGSLERLAAGDTQSSIPFVRQDSDLGLAARQLRALRERVRISSDLRAAFPSQGDRGARAMTAGLAAQAETVERLAARLDGAVREALRSQGQSSDGITEVQDRFKALSDGLKALRGQAGSDTSTDFSALEEAMTGLETAVRQCGSEGETARSALRDVEQALRDFTAPVGQIGRRAGALRDALRRL